MVKINELNDEFALTKTIDIKLQNKIKSPSKLTIVSPSLSPVKLNIREFSKLTLVTKETLRKQIVVNNKNISTLES